MNRTILESLMRIELLITSLMRIEYGDKNIIELYEEIQTKVAKKFDEIEGENENETI